jgi:hypothetical protein
MLKIHGLNSITKYDYNFLFKYLVDNIYIGISELEDFLLPEYRDVYKKLVCLEKDFLGEAYSKNMWNLDNPYNIWPFSGLGNLCNYMSKEEPFINPLHKLLGIPILSEVSVELLYQLFSKLGIQICIKPVLYRDVPKEYLLEDRIDMDSDMWMDGIDGNILQCPGPDNGDMFFMFGRITKFIHTSKGFDMMSPITNYYNNSPKKVHHFSLFDYPTTSRKKKVFGYDKTSYIGEGRTSACTSVFNTSNKSILNNLEDLLKDRTSKNPTATNSIESRKEAEYALYTLLNRISNSLTVCKMLLEHGYSIALDISIRSPAINEVLQKENGMYPSFGLDSEPETLGDIQHTFMLTIYELLIHKYGYGRLPYPICGAEDSFYTHIGKNINRILYMVQNYPYGNLMSNGIISECTYKFA